MVKIIWPSNIERFNEYMAGLVYGDGQLERERITITDSSEEFFDQLSKYINKFWELQPKIHMRKGYNAYYMRIYNTIKVKEIKQLIDKLVNRPTVNFIRGFFDAEGTIFYYQPWRRKYIVIELSSSNPVVIANIQTALYDRCIYAYTWAKDYFDKRPQKRKTYRIYILRIKRQSSVKRFLEKVGLRHPKHISKLSSQL